MLIDMLIIQVMLIGCAGLVVAHGRLFERADNNLEYSNLWAALCVPGYHVTSVSWHDCVLSAVGEADKRLHLERRGVMGNVSKNVR